MTPQEALDRVAVIAGEQGNEELLQLVSHLQFAVHDAAKWHRNKDAVYCANAMLQAARPTILNMLNCEQAVKDYER